MTHYYLHIKKAAIEIGYYDPIHLKPVAVNSYDSQNVDYDGIGRYLIGNEQQTILFYLHCWLGNINFYNKDVLRKLERLNVIDKTVSIVWESCGLRYYKSWEHARQQGKQLGELFEYLLNFNRESKNVMLCHSMGHSVFLGLADVLKADNKYFRLIFFAGADLPKNIFDKDLKHLNTLADRIVIYVHQHDHILRISSLLNHQKRLGIISPDEAKSLCALPNITIADVTKWPGNSAWSPSNHIYFKEHEGVRADMVRRIRDAID